MESYKEMIQQKWDRYRAGVPYMLEPFDPNADEDEQQVRFLIELVRALVRLPEDERLTESTGFNDQTGMLTLVKAKYPENDFFNVDIPCTIDGIAAWLEAGQPW